MLKLPWSAPPWLQPKHLGKKKPPSASPLFLSSLMLQKKLDYKVLAGMIKSLAGSSENDSPIGSVVWKLVSLPDMIIIAGACYFYQGRGRGVAMMKWIICTMEVKTNTSRSCLDVECGSLVGSLCSTSKPLCCFMDLFACDRSSKPTHHVCKHVRDNLPEVWEERDINLLSFLWCHDIVYCKLFLPALLTQTTRIQTLHGKKNHVQKLLPLLELNTCTEPKWKATFRTQFK